VLRVTQFFDRSLRSGPDRLRHQWPPRLSRPLRGGNTNIG
jgi:hypothetical protein